MTFAAAGSVITQTGTNTNLAGLSGLAGVTTLSRGGKTIYDIGTNRLVVQGTLTMDPNIEEILQGDANYPCVQIDASGTWNIGIPIVANSVSFYPQCTAMHLTRNATLSWDDANYGIFRVYGTCNHYCGTIYVRGPVAWGQNSTTGTYRAFSSSASFIATTASQDGAFPQLRQRSNNTNVQALTTRGCQLVMIGNVSLLKGFKPFHGNLGVSGSSASPVETWLTVRDFDGSGGPSSGNVGLRLKNVWLRFVNSVTGSAITAVGTDPSLVTPGNCGLLEVRQELSVAAKSAAGAAITNGGIFLMDRNNGVRVPYSDAGFGASRPNYETDRTYAAGFNGSGVASYLTDGGILTALLWRSEGGGWLDATLNKRDSRGETNDNADTWTCRVRSYGFFFSDVTMVLKGAGGNVESTTLFTNTDVVATRAVALAYSGITLADHGASPVAWNGKSWGITVTGNLTTNPGLTAQQIHDHLQASLAEVGTTFYGKPGGEWHNMVKRAGSNFFTESGAYGGLRAAKGVRVIDQAGNPFPGFTGMQSDDGTTYIPPVQYTFGLTGLLPDSEIRLIRQSDDVEIAGVESVTGSWSYNYVYSADIPVWVVIFRQASQPIRFAQTLSAANASIPIQQNIDRVFENF